MLCLSGFELYSRWVPLKIFMIIIIISNNFQSRTKVHELYSQCKLSWWMVMQISLLIARNLREILDSDRFVTKCFNRRSLAMSQALCLLWRGFWRGPRKENRKSSWKFSAPLYGMLLLLLLLTYTCLERVTNKDVPVIFLGVKYKSMAVKLNSRSQ